MGEDLLIVYKILNFKFIVVAIIIPKFQKNQSKQLSNFRYRELTRILSKRGRPSPRGALTTGSACRCQGAPVDYSRPKLSPPQRNRGHSITVGCARRANSSKHCKWAGSHLRKLVRQARRFKLLYFAGPRPEDTEDDKVKCRQMQRRLRDISFQLSDDVTACVETVIPGLVQDMASKVDHDCTIGLREQRCFSGVTYVCDFAAHGHTDSSNTVNGITAVVSLLGEKIRGRGMFFGDGEQLHVLPAYRLPNTETRVDRKVSFFLPHGSLLLEDAKAEYHASTAVPIPNMEAPSRIGIVLFTHIGLLKPLHGSSHLKGVDIPLKPQPPVRMIGCLGVKETYLTCHVCGKSYKHSRFLRRHAREAHSEASIIPCPECGRCFKRMEHLRKHTSRLHDPLKQPK
jgi:hypothetical protein